MKTKQLKVICPYCKKRLHGIIYIEACEDTMLVGARVRSIKLTKEEINCNKVSDEGGCDKREGR